MTSPAAAIAAFALVCLSFFAVNTFIDGSPEFLWADGAGYYAWARSVYFDGDVAFADEFAIAPWPAYGDARGADGGPLNKYSVGMALIELVPISVAAWLIAPFWPGPDAPAGYGGAYQLTLALFLLAGGVGSMAFFVRRLAHDRGRRTAALAAWAMLGATALVEFGAHDIAFTHLVDVALVCLLWLIADRPRPGLAAPGLAGLLAGLAVAVRATNVVLLPWIVAWSRYRGHAITRAGTAAAVVGAAVPAAAQLAANQAHRGAWLPEPYPSEVFTWLSPRIGETLWSLEAGWLTWHPVYVLLIAALAVSWRTFGGTRAGRAVWAAAVFAVVAHIWIVASWWSWQGGAMQFGHRLFIALTPMLVVMAAYGTRSGECRPAAAVLTVLVAWNLYLFVGVSVARLQHNWSPRLTDALGWEHRIGPAIAERLRRPER